jgi:hypothetical protein
MSHADPLPEGLIRRLCAQLEPLGVDVRMHVANVREMCARLPGTVENPPGLLVDWCNREAQARRAQAAALERDRAKYAALQVDAFRWVAQGDVTPRELAKVLDEASRQGYPALNRRTIELLRAMGNRWVPLAREEGAATNEGAAERDARGHGSEGDRPGRSDAGVQQA